MRIQSSRKKKKRTIAVAQWVATRKARKNSSFWWMFQPNSCGSDHRVAEARDRKRLGNALQ